MPEEQAGDTEKTAKHVHEVKHNPLQGLSEGRIVHYVLDAGRSKGQHRPAIVVRDWKQENGLVQLQVFTDGWNDGFNEVHQGEHGIVTLSSNVIWRTSVHYDENHEPGTWHWPERA